MLVARHMTRDPVTATPHDDLATSQAKMCEGGFRRLPIVDDRGRLVGVLTDGDVRQHVGHLAETKVGVAMTENPLTVAPSTTLEAAARLMLERKVGALPVMENGGIVGIVTTSDVLGAFLSVMGASEEGTVRLDLVLEGDHSDLSGACAVIRAEGGEVLSLGTYRESWEERAIFGIRVRCDDPARIAEALAESGYSVLDVHSAEEKDAAATIPLGPI